MYPLLIICNLERWITLTHTPIIYKLSLLSILYFYFHFSFQNPLKMPLEWLFGKRLTPEEMLRKNQRVLNKSMRDLDREKAHMEVQEKKLIAEIKKMAKDGQMVIIEFFTFFLRSSIQRKHHFFLGIRQNSRQRPRTNT